MTMRAHVSTPGRAHRTEGTRDIHRALPEEVPVALVFNGTTQAVMMATPADLADFALGFALTEGIVTDTAEVEEFEIVDHANGIEARFWLTEDRAQALAERRRTMAGPVGCGLCGIDSLDLCLKLPRWTGVIVKACALQSVTGVTVGNTESTRRVAGAGHRARRAQISRTVHHRRHYFAAIIAT